MEIADKTVIIGRIRNSSAEISLVLKENEPHIEISSYGEIDITDLFVRKHRKINIVSVSTSEGKNLVIRVRANLNDLISFCDELVREGMLIKRMGLSLPLLQDEVLKVYSTRYAKKLKE